MLLELLQEDDPHAVGMCYYMVVHDYMFKIFHESLEYQGVMYPLSPEVDQLRHALYEKDPFFFQDPRQRMTQGLPLTTEQIQSWAESTFLQWVRQESCPVRLLPNCLLMVVCRVGKRFLQRNVYSKEIRGICREMRLRKTECRDRLVKTLESVSYLCMERQAGSTSMWWWPFNVSAPYRPEPYRWFDALEDDDGERQASSMLTMEDGIDLDPVCHRIVSVDSGSLVFKCAVGDIMSSGKVHISHRPVMASYATQAASYRVVIAEEAFQDQDVLDTLAACHLMHPKTMLAANIPSNKCPFTTFYKLLPYVSLTKEAKGVVLGCAKEFSLCGGSIQHVDEDRQFCIPKTAYPQGVVLPVSYVFEPATWIADREGFFKIHQYLISAYAIWALQTLKRLSEMRLGSNLTLAYLIPNVMRPVEKTFLHYILDGMLSLPLKLDRILMVMEGDAEMMAYEMQNTHDEGVILGIVAGGCTGDTTLARRHADGQLELLSKSTTTLRESSSRALNVQLARWVRGKLVNPDIVDETVFMKALIDWADQWKMILEIEHRGAILSENTTGKTFTLQGNVEGVSIRVNLEVDTYVEMLTACIFPSIQMAQRVLRRFYKDNPDAPPVSHVFCSGGVFHQTGTILARRMLNRVSADCRLEPASPSAQRFLFAGGAVGGVGVALSLHPLQCRDIRYQRSDLQETTLTLPCLSRRNEYFEEPRFWKMVIITNVGIWEGVPGESMQVSAKCMADGSLFACVVMCRLGKDILWSTMQDEVVDGSFFFYDGQETLGVVGAHDYLWCRRDWGGQPGEVVDLTFRAELNAWDTRWECTVEVGYTDTPERHDWPVMLTAGWPTGTFQWSVLYKICPDSGVLLQDFREFSGHLVSVSSRDVSYIEDQIVELWFLLLRRLLRTFDADGLARAWGLSASAFIQTTTGQLDDKTDFWEEDVLRYTSMRSS